MWPAAGLRVHVCELSTGLKAALTALVFLDTKGEQGGAHAAMKPGKVPSFLLPMFRERNVHSWDVG